MRSTGLGYERKIQMTTMTKTTTSAVSRKLSELGFIRYSSEDTIGFNVMSGYDGIRVVNHVYGHATGTAGQELEALGYVIEDHQHLDWTAFLDRRVETFYVKGRVGA
jgi:hypothetical protein